ncbi:AtpZ/AtpI family protein [Helicobacter pylori]|uniref:AtpZ/AtpI family protein n=1 Tax=Helicobacter pylori TaxID=210 RepID=UPI0003474197|nr:AtpZ/AtpI family protein [Helicobacter pylori]
MATDEHGEKTDATEAKESKKTNAMIDFVKNNLQDQRYDTLGFILTGIILCVWCGWVGVIGIILVFIGIFIGLSNINLIKWFEKFKKNPKIKEATPKETTEIDGKDDKTEQEQPTLTTENKEKE